MELAKSYEPHAIERKWYPVWESRGYFKPSMDPAAKPYCIALPPPNVTGTLHMGHAFQQTLMDVLIRWHRMKGDNTLWQVGTDHAGIATQIVVEQQLKAEGASRLELGRAAFSERVWAWKEESGGAITQQMRRLGLSADWSRERFTMDAGLSAAVLETFVRLYEDGLIYRGKRLVNWDPKLGTAVSDLEVDSEEEQGKLWEIRYPLADRSDSVVVATTRPETMLGDTAVAVNPEDERYRHLVGKTITLPLTNRVIPIIADDYVDREFGTGVVKITPAHDFNDWAIAQRHGLPSLPILDLRGEGQRQRAGEVSRHGPLRRAQGRACRPRDAGLVVSEKSHKMIVPRCGRTGEVVEPMLTDQWYVAMTKPAPATHPFFPNRSIQDLCLAAVSDAGLPAGAPGSGENVAFVPGEWRSTYLHWINNIQDWCISRQLWWGHQIPAWYDEAGNVYVARDEAQARDQARAKLGREPQHVPPRRGRARHLVQLGAVVPLDARLAGRHAGASHVPADERAGHRLRHHLLLGRAHDHDDDLLHRPRAVPRRVHQRDRARRGRPEDVEVEGQRPRSGRPDRRRRRRNAGREAHGEHDGSAADGNDRQAHAQAVPERHPRVRRRRAALHVREPRDVRPDAELRPVALRGLSQLQQQAVERDEVRADEHASARTTASKARSLR